MFAFNALMYKMLINSNKTKEMQTWSQGQDFQGQGPAIQGQGMGSQGQGLDCQGQSQNQGLIYFIYTWSQKCIAYIMHSIIYIEFCSKYGKDNKCFVNVSMDDTSYTTQTQFYTCSLQVCEHFISHSGTMRIKSPDWLNTLSSSAEVTEQ